MFLAFEHLTLAAKAVPQEDFDLMAYTDIMTDEFAQHAREKLAEYYEARKTEWEIEEAGLSGEGLAALKAARRVERIAFLMSLRDDDVRLLKTVAGPEFSQDFLMYARG